MILEEFLNTCVFDVITFQNNKKNDGSLIESVKRAEKEYNNYLQWNKKQSREIKADEKCLNINNLAYWPKFPSILYLFVYLILILH